jgi:hypothetical protein
VLLVVQEWHLQFLVHKYFMQVVEVVVGIIQYHQPPQEAEMAQEMRVVALLLYLQLLALQILAEAVALVEV